MVLRQRRVYALVWRRHGGLASSLQMVHPPTLSSPQQSWQMRALLVGTIIFLPAPRAKASIWFPAALGRSTKRRG